MSDSEWSGTSSFREKSKQLLRDFKAEYLRNLSNSRTGGMG